MTSAYALKGSKDLVEFVRALHNGTKEAAATGAP